MGHVFVSYSASEQAAADEVQGILEGCGHRVFVASRGIRPGDDWRESLFHQLRLCDAVVFLNSRKAQSSLWCHTELAVVENLHKRIYQVGVEVGVKVYKIISRFQAIAFDIDVATTAQALIAQLEVDGVAERLFAPWDRTRPPYVGLEPLDVADAGVFFGREDELKALMQRVIVPGERDGRIVIVTGPSGAGKSSLVRAGLAARLDHPPSSWLVADPFEPTGRPLDQLVSALAALGRLDRNVCRELLTAENGGLGAYAARVVDADHSRVLVIVDQADQLVGAAANHFMHVLSTLRQDTPVTVVMTVRADRLDELVSALPAVGPWIDDPVLVGPIRRAALPKIIAGPAEQADIAVGVDLVAALMSDAALGNKDTIDSMPLLASALRDMWDAAVGRGGRREITLEDYDHLDGIEGAIRKRAEAAEGKVEPGKRGLLDSVLRQFLTLDRDRRPAAKALALAGLSEDEKAVVGTLRAYRLVTTTADTARLAHEYLLEAWPRLDAVVKRSQDDLLLGDRLTGRADDWASGRGTLLSREGAGEAIAWADRQSRPEETRPIRGYAEESLKAADELLAAAARRRRNKRAGVAVLAVVAIVVAIVAAVAAGVAVRSDSRARREAGIARTDALSAERNSARAESIAAAAQATKMLATNVPVGTLMSIAAYQASPTAQAANAVALAASEPIAATQTFGAQGANSVPPTWVILSPDGHTLAVWGANEILVEDPPGSSPRVLRTTTAGFNSLTFSRDSTTLAIATLNAGVQIVRLADGATTGTIDQGAVDAVASSPDGQTLATYIDTGSGSGGHLELHRLATGATATLALSRAESEFPGGIAYSPDGTKLALSVLYGPTFLIDLATGATTTVSTAIGYGNAVFSGNGEILARGMSTGVTLYHVDTGAADTVADGTVAESVAFNPAGDTLAWGDQTGAVVDDLHSGRTTTLGQGSRVEGLAFTADGTTLITGNDDGQIDTWDLHRLAEATFNGQSPATSIAFSGDGRLLASGNSDGTVTIENLGDDTTSTVEVTGAVSAVALNQAGTGFGVEVEYPGGFIGKTELVNLATRRATTLADPSDVSLSMAFSPDGTTLAVDYIESPTLYNLDSGRSEQISVPLGGLSLAYSDDGRFLALGSDSLGLYDTASGTVQSFLKGPLENAVAFNPAGTEVAVAQSGGGVVLVNLATRAQRTIDDGFAVRSVAISPDGSTLAIGDSDGQVILVNLATGSRITLSDQYLIREVLFNPAGTELATVNEAGQIHLYDATVWTLDFQAQTARLCRQLGNPSLSRAQWSLYLPGIAYHRICP